MPTAPISWEAVSCEDSYAAKKVAQRAIKLNLYDGIDALKTAWMDVEACHLLVPLNLLKLLHFNDANFIHDLAGIRDCLDRDNFRMRNNFLPKCHA